ncbi:HDOD domain-containing protein [Desulfosarcina sp.]|uniref:HDOD domain-containing protein n=1 Tax=Desulfosarcina sp. TaxID=2027861 RepID=UPI003970E5EB
MQNAFFDQIATLKNLPTLPHILLNLFEACNRDSVDLEEIAAIVSKDPALSAKILKLVNSAYFGLSQKIQEINHAVVLVGTSGIRNMAICACVYEAFPKPKKNTNFNLKAFWWHSLRCAFLAKTIAAKIQAEQPDEAFVCGLLHDIGKVVLWVNFPAAYDGLLADCRSDGQRLTAVEARLGATHCEVAAWLLHRWKFQTVIADSARYHHEPPDRIAQALLMTQIVWVANCLSQDDSARIDAGVVAAQNILGLPADQCHALIEKSGQEATDVAAALGIDMRTGQPDPETIDPKDRQVQDELVWNVRNLALLMGSLEGFLSASETSDMLSVISNGLKILLDVDRCLCFLYDAEKGILRGYTQDQTGRYRKNHGLAVSMGMDQSLLVRTLVEKQPMDSLHAQERHPLTILDNQLLRLLDGQGLFYLPLVARGDAVGVLVLAIQKNDLPHLLKKVPLLNLLGHQGAMALQLHQLKRQQLQAIQATRAEAAGDLAKRVVHEVNNPLSIIKNYLKILEIKFSGKEIPLDEIRIINEEISRAAHLLKSLTQFSTPKKPTRETTDINSLLMDIVTLTKESLLRHANVNLHTNLDPGLPAVLAEKAGLKQVFINLIKNAAEAMQSGGNLFIETRHVPPPIGGKLGHGKKGSSGYAEIQFKDDGPGISEAMQAKLFDPYVSSKQGMHAGLGLSIAYNIIRSLHGRITCESIMDKGTVFKIELPLQAGG